MQTGELAKRIRIHSLGMTRRAKSSHVGSAFSIAEIVAVLYNEILKVNPEDPGAFDRDRFILSKGHAGMAVYAALAEKGFFPVGQLQTYNVDDSILCGHISHKGVPGVEASTGSLGHGLALASGMAFAAKSDGRNHRVFALLSDGECDEGSTWEAVLFAAHHGLENLTVIVDYNKIQSLAPVAETMALEPFADKWKSFGWSLREVDGHDPAQIGNALRAVPFTAGRPSLILAHTIKGKGVSFMEGTVLWHYRSPQGEEYEAALRELEAGS